MLFLHQYYKYLCVSYLSIIPLLQKCVTGLQLSYLTWGVVQEQLMTKEYAAGKFSSSAFCVFMNRFLALFIALAIVTYRKSQSANTKPQEAPTVYYAPSSISNSISSWAQYEALKYVSFPTTTLSKSCKIIPVMLVGILVNKKVTVAIAIAFAISKAFYFLTLTYCCPCLKS